MLRIFVLLLIIPCYSIAQDDKNEGVYQPINDFIEGTTYNYPEKILNAFLPGTNMFLYNDADTLMVYSVEKYASLYNNGRRGQQNQRFSTLISLDVVENVAYAKLEVDIPSFSRRYYDLLLLKKIGTDWKIVSKCTDAIPIPKTPQEAKPHPVKEVILEGLKKPWSMAFINENEIIIVEKDGGLIKSNLQSGERIAIRGLPTDIAQAVMIDTSKHVWGTFPPSAHGTSQTYNAGLFQILLDPDFENNQFIYLSYAAENSQRASAVKVIKARLNDDQLSNMTTLFEGGVYSHGLFHYGGGMIIGPDEKLYITLGERNLFEQNNPPLPLSQDLKDKRGKVIRINLDGTIPSDNPDFGPNAIKGLFALGIRASQGLAVQPETGEIWFSEHGTLQGDEINKLKAGANYGWPYKTSGRYRTADYAPEFSEGLTFEDPVHFWDQTVAPTGLTFYKGREFPQWKGNLIVPGLSKGSLWRLELDNDKVVAAEELFINDRVRLRKAILSPRGYLYVLTDEENGKLIKVKNSTN
ncbi:PQQ-dependent sugar dehydrogenase [Portibacter lacus]|uniref:Glucose/Sorbosone dehydrogenase domain-containing protein n=1 Tax=Portibacter lacus TaxID=1099794 RepID=A0AA37SNJ5_9BACT|nr:PQQ-dependent sugar dehydrogenase [Portibacter lacus]GLR16819.1 hypothetical protein GCM10007940_14340 [Portibacter lacus]